MPLDPQVEALLAGLNAMNLPPLVDMTREEARAAFARMAALGGPPEALAAVDRVGATFFCEGGIADDRRRVDPSRWRIAPDGSPKFDQ